MFCPRFSCISEALKNRGNDLLCPAAPMPLDAVTSSSQRRAPLPLSTAPATNTLMTKLALCISMLLCDMEKPSLVKHSQMMSMAQPTPGTTHQLS